jgi:hypothetical protein
MRDNARAYRTCGAAAEIWGRPEKLGGGRRVACPLQQAQGTGTVYRP